MHRLRGWLAVTLGAAALTPFHVHAADLHVRVVDAAGRPLANAIVYAEPGVPAPQAKPPKAVVDQVNRQFVPRVSVVQAGTSVYFPNSDNIRHSVYSFSPAKTFELSLYAGQAAPPVLFDKPGIVVLGCEIHDNMVAWVLVVDTPFHAKSDMQGRVTLRNLPAGDYGLHAWHEPMRAATTAEPLHVRAGASPPEVTLKINANTASAPAPAMPAMSGMKQ
ncbi:MAG TPA: methylamine utilization protein [Steroidobacteraceae bacterium]|nr:methylamine utilization protein [Steroidobacteraceae bacterium]